MSLRQNDVYIKRKEDWNKGPESFSVVTTQSVGFITWLRQRPFWLLSSQFCCGYVRLPGSRVLVTYRQSQKNLKGKHNWEDIFCFFFLSLYLQWQRFLRIFRSEVLVGFLTCAFLLQGWEITLLFRARHFALGTDLEISTFHFRFPPKDLKVFWSVNTQIPFELYGLKLEYLCLLKETRHSLIMVITDANNILCCQRLSHGILDL